MSNNLIPRRLLAFTIDLAILVSVSTILIVFSFTGFIENDNDLRFIVITCYLLYFYICAFYNKGQTIGKKICKIRISNIKRDDDSVIGLFIRESVFLLAPLIIRFIFNACDWLLWGLTVNNYFSPYIGYIGLSTTLSIPLSILLSKHSMGIHDILSKTRIVSVENKTRKNLEDINNYSQEIRVHVLKYLWLSVLSLLVIAICFKPLEKYILTLRSSNIYLSELSEPLMNISKNMNNVYEYIDRDKKSTIKLSGDIKRDCNITFKKSPFDINDETKSLLRGPYLEYSIPVTLHGLLSRDFLIVFPKAFIDANNNLDYNSILYFKASHECGFFSINITRSLIILKQNNKYTIIEPSEFIKAGIDFHSI